jgi:twitching motility protein PilT
MSNRLRTRREFEMAWIHALLHEMVAQGCSDLHMSSLERPMFRLHGEMSPVEGTVPIKPEEMVTVLREITSQEHWEIFEKDWDHDYAYALEGAGRFRVNLFYDHKGPGAVFRLIPEKIPTAQQLGLPAVITEMCNHTKGLILVTGPTGSGKSTTLAAMIDHINNTRPDHIITIEDPIEFVHPNKRCLVNQREVSRHTKGFKRALKAALREDPDIVLVGELRDLETIAIAIETAETGHLVFGTLHTSTAPSTVNRIIDQFPAGQQAQIRMMLASSLRGVISQTLLKKQGGGRVAAHEILVANSAVSALIREGKTHQILSCMQTGAKDGMQLLTDALVGIVKQGLVSPEEAYLKCVQKDDLLNKFRSAGISVSMSGGDHHQRAPGSGVPPSPAIAGASNGNGRSGYADPTVQYRQQRATNGR